jgi:hypothetical protein
MKLLNVFKNLIEEIQPEICWFTTFNMNLELVEKYILTAIAGKDSSELKRAEDFEALNLELDKLNIKIWYDYRALDLKQAKRTTVDIFPIETSLLLESNNQDSIFHPKVIFLKGAKGAYLIAGSFNLTIAGWSSNRESIIIKEIKIKENAFQVIEFFQNLKVEYSDIIKLSKWANQLPNIKSTWKFINNFNTDSFLEEIKGKEIFIWSPYFSKNTSDLLNQIKKIGFESINLIPDINQAQKVKISPSELISIADDPAIKIQNDTNIIKEKQPLFHAKVWLSETKIAVGSWNCSYKATGIKTASKDRNVEAGIIDSINEKQRDKLLSSLKAISIDNINGTTTDELDKEWSNSLSAFTMSCEICANWETFEYEFQFEDGYNDYSVELPHNLKQKYSLAEVNQLSFIDSFNRILKNKLFTVYNANNEIAFVGYLNESGKQKRPVDGYISFYDLFESLSTNPLERTNKTRVKYQLDEEDEIGSEKEELPFFTYKGHESFYLMFVAFQKLLDTLEGNKQNIQKIEDLGYRLPSSLINIKSLFNTSLNKLLESISEDDLLFHYFMAMEINACIETFNRVSVRPMELLNIDKLQTLLKLDTKDLKFIKKAMTIK